MMKVEKSLSQIQMMKQVVQINEIDVIDLYNWKRFLLTADSLIEKFELKP